MKATDRDYALSLDAKDPLAKYKSQFVITDPDLCYLDGNSLGRLPKKTIESISNFLTNEWGPEVVTGWSHWVDEAQPTGDLLGAAALGAAAGQILVCDTTSVNFYQLCLAAIKARPDRKTIITDKAAIAIVAAIKPLYPKIGLREKTGKISVAIPKNGSAKPYED